MIESFLLAALLQAASAEFSALPAVSSWAQILQLVVIAVLTVLGLYMNTKFSKFEEKYVRPLSEKLTQESSSRAVAIEKMVGLIGGLDKTTKSLEHIAEKMDADARTQAIELGQHREQIATLFRRFDRHEDRVTAIEQHTERRRET